MDGPRDYNIILSKVSQKKTNTISLMWNLKYDTNELIHKAETDSQTLKTSVWLPKGELGVAG